MHHLKASLECAKDESNITSDETSLRHLVPSVDLNVHFGGG